MSSHTVFSTAKHGCQNHRLPNARYFETLACLWKRAAENMATLNIKNDVAKGTFYMVLAALLFALGATTARFASNGLNTFALVFWTNLWMFVLISIWILFRRPASGIATKRLSQHFLRAIFTYVALVTYFYAIAHIQFANAVVLQSLGPVIVPILAFIVFRRLSDRFVWLGISISFVGVTVIIQPDRFGMSIGEAFGILAAVGGRGRGPCDLVSVHHRTS